MPGDLPVCGAEIVRLYKDLCTGRARQVRLLIPLGRCSKNLEIFWARSRESPTTPRSMPRNVGATQAAEPANECLKCLERYLGMEQREPHCTTICVQKKWGSSGCWSRQAGARNAWISNGIEPRGPRWSQGSRVQCPEMAAASQFQVANLNPTARLVSIANCSGSNSPPSLMTGESTIPAHTAEVISTVLAVETPTPRQSIHFNLWPQSKMPAQPHCQVSTNDWLCMYSD